MKTIEEVNELRQVICDYYARKEDEEVEKLWESKSHQMSGVVRHEWPISLAHFQGLLLPHSHMLRKMGRPVSTIASAMPRMISSLTNCSAYHYSDN